MDTCLTAFLNDPSDAWERHVKGIDFHSEQEQLVLLLHSAHSPNEVHAWLQVCSTRGLIADDSPVHQPHRFRDIAGALFAKSHQSDVEAFWAHYIDTAHGLAGADEAAQEHPVKVPRVAASHADDVGALLDCASRCPPPETPGSGLQCLKTRAVSERPAVVAALFELVRAAVHDEHVMYLGYGVAQLLRGCLVEGDRPLLLTCLDECLAAVRDGVRGRGPGCPEVHRSAFLLWCCLPHLGPDCSALLYDQPPQRTGAPARQREAVGAGYVPSLLLSIGHCCALTDSGLFRAMAEASMVAIILSMDVPMLRSERPLLMPLLQVLPDVVSDSLQTLLLSVPQGTGTDA